MTKSQNKKMNWRSFTSLYIVFSGFFILISGIILYIAPSGRVAKWTYLTILGLEKDEWQALHIIFTFLIIIASGFHLYYNWKPFISYLHTKTKEKFTLKKELVLSVLVTILVFFLVLGNVPPFSNVLDLGEYFTESWENDSTEPPVSHAESMSFAELSVTINIPVEEMLKNLKQNQVIATENEIIKDVADNNSLTPLEIFKKMNTVKKTSSSSSYYGSGLGKKSLLEVCKQLNIDIDIALQRLAITGIKANSEMILKDIAKKNDKNPIDIIEIINKKQ